MIKRSQKAQKGQKGPKSPTTLKELLLTIILDYLLCMCKVIFWYMPLNFEFNISKIMNVDKIGLVSHSHRHLSNIDCLTVHTACLVCFISTVSSHRKKALEDWH